MSKYFTVAATLMAAASAKVYFHEDFTNRDKWVDSNSRSDFGKLVLSPGEVVGETTISKGLKTSQDARFYSSSAKLDEPFTNEGKDFVVSLSVKHEQGLDCGGGYIKIMPAMEAEKFNGDTEYFLMFGPDQCGYNKRVHVIFNYKGENHLWKKEPTYPDDKLTHVYTLRVTPENKYEMYIDQELKESGSLEDDWKLLPPQKIDDPEDKKPADWVDEPEIEDPEDKKPADWDSEPEQIADPEATKPDDWDDAEDGEWETPMVPNPKHKGEWRARRISNPAYKGQWSPKQIANPKYELDDKLYMTRKPIEHVGIDIWQVKSGTVFGDIIIGDNFEEVNAIVDKSFKAIKEAEKTAAATEKKAEDTKEDAKDDSHDEDL